MIRTRNLLSLWHVLYHSATTAAPSYFVYNTGPFVWLFNTICGSPGKVFGFHRLVLLIRYRVLTRRPR